MIYAISDKDLKVSINTFGAEIVSAVYNGIERVWQNKNGKWSGHGPVLFPVCGNSAVVIDGKDYNMPFHGLAKRNEFSVVSVDEKSITLLFKYDDRTLEVYPFKFEFFVTYTVEDNSIKVNYVVKNVGDNDMPFAVGRHDSFALNRSLDDYRLIFSSKESFLAERHDNRGRLINIYDDLGMGKVLNLPDNRLIGGHTVIFGGINSNSVILETDEGKNVAEVRFNGISNLLLWRPDDSQMICIEPWSALPDVENTIDFTENEKYFVIKPEEQVDFMQNEKYYRLKKSEEKDLSFEIRYF